MLFLSLLLVVHLLFPRYGSADEVTLRYEFLERHPGTNQETWVLGFQLHNYSAQAIRNISIEILSDVAVLASVKPLWVDLVDSGGGVKVTGLFSIPNAYLPPENLPLKFYVVYEGEEGYPVSGVFEGLPVESFSEAIP